MQNPLNVTQLAEFEDYLLSLLEPLGWTHGDSNIQIYFDGEWGFIYDGEFYPTSKLSKLEATIANHCDECEARTKEK